MAIADSVDSNGKTNGISLPSAEGQEAATHKGHAKAGLEFSQTGYVECHGTGTKIGDAMAGESHDYAVKLCCFYGHYFPFLGLRYEYAAANLNCVP